MNITFYKIYCKDINITDCYIGSTTNFNQRKICHKNNCNNEKGKKYNLKVYQFIRENRNWNNWIIEEIERKICESMEEARIREQELIVEFNATLNSRSAILNKEKKLKYIKDYRNENKEFILQQQREYKKKNKEIILQYEREYYNENKEILNQRQRERYDENKEILNQRQREYYNKNKEILNQKRRELYDENKEILNQRQREYRAKKKLEKKIQTDLLLSSSS